MRLRHLAVLAAVHITALSCAGHVTARTAEPLSSQGQAVHDMASALIKGSNLERLAVLTEALDKSGMAYQLQSFDGGNDRTGPMAGTNIVITLGEGPADLVMTAHYDAVVLRDGSFSHGVVDNAGGVLTVLNAVKALPPLNHRLIVVLTDQEELGLIGARKWLEQADASRIKAVVNIDVAAYGRTVMYGLNNGEASRPLNQTLGHLCAETATDCVAFPVYPPSDDRVFSRAGIPVLSMGIQNPVGARQMWLAFNGGEDNGLEDGFVPDVFRNIHSHEDAIDKLKGDDVVAFSGFLARLVRTLDAR